jgi:UrcA family protein
MTNIRNSNLRSVAFALAALVTTTSSAVAREQVSVAVHYGDLNLASQAGVETLDRRLDRAVRRVCGSPIQRNLQMAQTIANCHEDTWNDIRSAREVAIGKAAGQQRGDTEFASNSGNRTAIALSK